VLLIFGTKKLRNLGSDLGNAIKSFKKAAKEEDYVENPELSKKSIKDSGYDKEKVEEKTSF